MHVQVPTGKSGTTGATGSSGYTGPTGFTGTKGPTGVLPRLSIWYAEMLRQLKGLPHMCWMPSWMPFHTYFEVLSGAGLYLGNYLIRSLQVKS